MEIDPAVRNVLNDLKRRLQRRYGERFAGLYLFGGRARGPGPFEEGSLEQPDGHPYAEVSRAVRRDGVPL